MLEAVADHGGGGEGAMPPPGPVKINHKKDGCRRRPHICHVSWPPPYPAAGSATGKPQKSSIVSVICQIPYLGLENPAVCRDKFTEN